MDIIEFEQEKDSLIYYVKIRTDVIKHKTGFIKVDTGAAVTLIGKDLVSDTVLSNLKFTEVIGTVGGDVLTAPATLRLLGIGKHTFGGMQVHVHPKWERGTINGKKILLGFDILKYFDFNFNSKTQKFRLAIQEGNSKLPFVLYKNTDIDKIKVKRDVKGFLSS